jgi:hypothetical protein
MDEPHFAVLLKAMQGLADFVESKGKLGVADLDDAEEQLKREVMTEVMQAAGILAGRPAGKALFRELITSREAIG